jgi:hypothetical protein
LQNSPLESSCVIIARVENYSTSKPLKASPEKLQILSCDTLVANERYIYSISGLSFFLLLVTNLQYIKMMVFLDVTQCI